MSKDKNVNLKITADSKQAEKGLNKVTSELNKLSKKVSKSPITTLSASVAPMLKVAKTVVAGVKKIAGTFIELSENYKVQVKAERELETAAKNNPYLNGNNVKALKEYASQIQKYSDFGDEQLLPLMAKLAAAGRTQEEIMQTMAVATDIAASGDMSLEQAVSQLNKTYSGNVGLLKNQIAGIKDLTQEDLKNGKAVELIGQKYKDMAKNTADPAKQLNNSFGDLKENLGEIANFIIGPLQKAITGMINGLNKAFDTLNQKNNWITGITPEEKEIQVAEVEIERLNKVIEAKQNTAAQNEQVLEKKRAAFLKKVRAKSYEELTGLNKQYWDDNLQGSQKYFNDEILLLQKQIEEQEAIIADATERQKNQVTGGITEADQKVQDALDAYNKTIADWQTNIQARKNSGEVITEEAQAQEELNTKIAAYIEYYKTVGEMGKTAGQGILDDIKNLSASVDASSFLSTYGSKDSKSEVEILKETIAQLDTEYQALIENTELTEEQKYTIRETWAQKTEDLYKKIGEAEKKSTAETVQAIMETVTSSLTSLSDTMNTIADLNTKNAENHATVETAALEKQYAAGELSLEEYEKEKEKIEKKAAKKQYKMQLSVWGLQLATATANIAQGATKALAEGGAIMGPVQAALVTMSGAAQLATIIANKPIPPSFATGGIVPGTSYSGDNVRANVNSGEMILNAAQQKQLWAVANGRQNNTGAGLNVNIKNYMGDSASVTSNMTSDGLEIVVNKIVQKNLSNGNYRESLIQANNNMNGDVYVS